MPRFTMHKCEPFCRRRSKPCCSKNRASCSQLTAPSLGDILRRRQKLYRNRQVLAAIVCELGPVSTGDRKPASFEYTIEHVALEAIFDEQLSSLDKVAGSLLAVATLTANVEARECSNYKVALAVKGRRQ